MNPLDRVKQKIDRGNVNVSGMVKTIIDPLVITVEEARAIANSNLSHPLSSDLLVSVGGMNSQQEVTVDVNDAKAIIENRELLIDEGLEASADGTKHRRVVRKKLGDKLGEPVSEPPVIHNRKNDPLPEVEEEEADDQT